MADLQLRAPRNHLGILAAPDWPGLPGLIDANQQFFHDTTQELGRLPLNEIRQQARRDVQSLASAYLAELGFAQPGPLLVPLIVTGHQPELYHPGVWAKNFAAHALATRHGLVGLNVVVDNDNVKSTRLRVPTQRDGELLTTTLPFDTWQPAVAWEERRLVDARTFAEAPPAVTEAMQPLGVRPLLADGWRDNDSPWLGHRLTASRHGWEEQWGCKNLEVPLSRLCQTAAFATFAQEVLKDLPRFHDAYNETLRAYRRRHRLKSGQHPAPDLAQVGDTLEAPFWIWRAGANPRGRLFVRAGAGRLRLESSGSLFAELPLPAATPAAAWRQAWAALELQGIKVRTRALTTTMFLRLCVATLFIHGIGGAIYDQLTDAIVRRYFGVQLPGHFTLSATLWLKDVGGDNIADRATLIRHVRDVIYQPDRFLGVSPQPELIAVAAEKRRWVQVEPATRIERQQRFDAIRALNARLLPHASPALHSARSHLARLEEEAQTRATWHDRELAGCLHEAANIQTLVNKLRELASSGSNQNE